jgi:hypothetical protein
MKPPHKPEGTLAASAVHASPVNRREEFFIDRDPLTGAKLDPPEQLDLNPNPKPPGLTVRNANALIRRHQKGLRDAAE